MGITSNAAADAVRRRRVLTPSEAYDLSEIQKDRAARDFLRELVGYYRESKRGKTPAIVKTQAQSGALAAFVRAVDERLGNRPPVSDEQLQGAIRHAYRKIAVERGIKQITPASPNFERDLDEYFRNYETNFPIAEERETKEGYREIMQLPPRADGYQERTYSVVCPITGRYLMGIDFAIQPESNTAHFTYGFVMPWARRSVGFSGPLIETIQKMAAEHIARYPTQFPGKPVITFEKNVLGDMSLQEILLDTAGVDIARPPREGDDLSESSIGQSIRDLIWSRQGAKTVNFSYIQSSLDGVVKIDDPRKEQLVIRYLNNDPGLTAKDRQAAETALKKAVGDKTEGCRTLNLCVFLPPGVETVNAAQIARAMKIFQGSSVVKDPAYIEEDVYFKAMMADLKSKTLPDGTVALGRIKPFGIEGVESFQDAEALTKILLQHVTWKELRANADRPYAEWLQAKMDAVKPAFRLHKEKQKAAAQINAVREAAVADVKKIVKNPPTVYDAVIVGGSITGLIAAYEILAKNPKAKILVLEKGIIGESVGGRSGGHIVLGLDGFGEDHPNRQAVNRLIMQGHKRLVDIIRTEKIECDLSMNYALLGTSQEDLSGMRKLLVESFGYNPDSLKRDSASQAAGIGFQGFSRAFQTDVIGQLNPAKYLKGLAAVIRRRGGKIRENTAYQGSQWNGEHHVIQTTRGQVRAKILVLAPGADSAMKISGLEGKIDRVYTASVRIGPLDSKDMKIISKDGKPFAFADSNLTGDVLWGSLTPDGYLVAGFGEFKTWPTDAELAPLRQRLLEILPKSVAAKVAAGRYKPEFTVGPLSVTENLLPVVGRLDPRTPGLYVTTGFAGRAISQSAAAGSAIAKDMAGEGEELELFESLNQNVFTGASRPGPKAPPQAQARPRGV